MSTDNLVLSSLRESLFDGRRSNSPSGTSALLQRLSRVSGLHPLYSDFYKFGRVKGLFGFHYFKPSLNCFLDIGEGFFICGALRKTSWKRRHFSYIVSCFVFIYHYVKFHIVSSLRKAFIEIYHINNLLSKKWKAFGLKMDLKNY